MESAKQAIFPPFDVKHISSADRIAQMREDASRFRGIPAVGIEPKQSRSKETDASPALQAKVRARITELRVERGWTLTELANTVRPAAPVSEIQKLEASSPSTPPRRLTLGWLERLARAFDVPISALLPEEEIDIRTDSEASQILELLRDLAPEHRTRMVEIATALMRIVAPAPTPPLQGGDDIVGEMVRAWNGLSEAEKQRAVGAISVIKGGR